MLRCCAGCGSHSGHSFPSTAAPHEDALPAPTPAAPRRREGSWGTWGAGGSTCKEGGGSDMATGQTHNLLSLLSSARWENRLRKLVGQVKTGRFLTVMGKTSSTWGKLQ